jgi:hypothetical protein
MKCWASVYLGGTGLLLPLAEWQVIALFPSVGNLMFLLFGRGARAPLLSETVGSTWSLCSVERKASWCQKIANHGAWGSLGCVVEGSWH